MTIEQVRRRYRISLIGIPIIMLSMLAVRYGVALNPYMRLGAVFAVVAIGAVILSWGMRYGDMLDVHNAAVAAAKKQPPPPSSSGDDSATEAPEAAKNNPPVLTQRGGPCSTSPTPL